MTRRRGRRRKKLLDDLKDKKGYCQLKEEALDRTMWRNRFGRGFGPVIQQTAAADDDDDGTSIKNVVLVSIIQPGRPGVGSPISTHFLTTTTYHTKFISTLLYTERDK